MTAGRSRLIMDGEMRDGWDAMGDAVERMLVEIPTRIARCKICHVTLVVKRDLGEERRNIK
jgi:hypothetical protein